MEVEDGNGKIAKENRKLERLGYDWRYKESRTVAVKRELWSRGSTKRAIDVRQRGASYCDSPLQRLSNVPR